MFLKICSRDEKAQSTHESLHECRRLFKTQDKDGILFTLENDGTNDSLNIAINGGKRRNIYIMNSEGKTIERITWNPKEEGQSFQKS